MPAGFWFCVLLLSFAFHELLKAPHLQQGQLNINNFQCVNIMYMMYNISVVIGKDVWEIDLRIIWVIMNDHKRVLERDDTGS